MSNILVSCRIPSSFSIMNLKGETILLHFCIVEKITERKIIVYDHEGGIIAIYDFITKALWTITRNENLQPLVYVPKHQVLICISEKGRLVAASIKGSILFESNFCLSGIYDAHVCSGEDKIIIKSHGSLLLYSLDFIQKKFEFLDEWEGSSNDPYTYKKEQDLIAVSDFYGTTLLKIENNKFIEKQGPIGYYPYGMIWQTSFISKTEILFTEKRIVGILDIDKEEIVKEIQTPCLWDIFSIHRNKIFLAERNMVYITNSKLENLEKLYIFPSEVSVEKFCIMEWIPPEREKMNTMRFCKTFTDIILR